MRARAPGETTRTGRDGHNPPTGVGLDHAAKRRRSGTRDGLSVCPISSSNATYSDASFGRSRAARRRSFFDAMMQNEQEHRDIPAR